MVALSGGMKSMVVASLLKIQKYDLIAVTVVNGIDILGEAQPQLLSCHLTGQGKESITAFCRQLGIPHHFVNASNEFKEEVVEAWAGARVSGNFSQPCLNCHHQRINMVFQKMKQLGANKFATGHLAKIYQQESSGHCQVHTANDEEFDQSSLVASLGPELLSALMLPLSDLQIKEVQKLSENFGIIPIGKEVEPGKCFPMEEKVISYLHTLLPPSMIKPGEVHSLDEEQIYQDHQGVISYSYGAKVELENNIENKFFVGFSLSNKKILIDEETFFTRDRLMLTNCIFSEEVQLSAPLRGVLKSSSGEYIECWIHPGTLHSALVLLDAPTKVMEGEVLTVFRKKGKNSKIYLSGKVSYLAVTASKEEDKNVKADFSRDW